MVQACPWQLQCLNASSFNDVARYLVTRQSTTLMEILSSTYFDLRFFPFGHFPPKFSEQLPRRTRLRDDRIPLCLLVDSRGRIPWQVREIMVWFRKFLQSAFYLFLIETVPRPFFISAPTGARSSDTECRSREHLDSSPTFVCLLDSRVGPGRVCLDTLEGVWHESTNQIS